MKRFLGFIAGFVIIALTISLAGPTSINLDELYAYIFVALFGGLCGAYVADDF